MPKEKRKSNSNGHANNYRVHSGSSDSSTDSGKTECSPFLNFFKGSRQKQKAAPKTPSSANNGTTKNGAAPLMHTGATQDLLDMSLESNPRCSPRGQQDTSPSPTNIDGGVASKVDGLSEDTAARLHLRKVLTESGKVNEKRQKCVIFRQFQMSFFSVMTLKPNQLAKFSSSTTPFNLDQIGLVMVANGTWKLQSGFLKSTVLR